MATVKQYNLAGLNANVELGKQGSYIAGTANAVNFYTATDELQKLSIANAVASNQAVTLAQLNAEAQDLVQHITVDVSHTSGAANIATIPAGSRILSVTVEIPAAWSAENNTGTFIEVGDTDSGSRFIRSQDVDVLRVDQYHSQYQYEYLTEGTLTYSVTAGGATGGNATISVVLATDYALDTSSAPAPSGVTGQEEFLTAGTFSWTAPEGVTSVSAVVVAGGAGHSFERQSQFGPDVLRSGGGGALAWRNNISVTPGESYTVVVGSGGLNLVFTTTPPDSTVNGGDSYFMSITPNTGLGVWAQGAQQTAGGKPMYTGATPPEGLGTRGVDWDGGEGGDGAMTSRPGTTGNVAQPGGGGAGGYGVRNGTSKSGSGGTTGSASAGTDNGGGGGGAGTPGGGSGGSAGGVGLRGEGPTGAAGFIGNGNNSRGGFGSAINGATDLEQYADTVSAGRGGGAGFQWSAGSGGVRIIWGTGRSFPSTNTGNL